MADFDVFGHALNDYLIGNDDTELILHNSYGDPEYLPVSIFFREIEDLTQLEMTAINLCQGEILDIGAGVGAITIIAQEHFNITGLERSKDACEIATQLGVKNMVNEDIWSFGGQRYDTLLMLMNGIGIVGKFKSLKPFLNHLSTLLKPEGQIILDSSDLSYLFPAFETNPELGEISFQYEYKGNKGDWFEWLFIDQDTLTKCASEVGFDTEIMMQNEDDQYLARLTLVR